MVLVVPAVGFTTSGGKAFTSNEVAEVGVSQETPLGAQTSYADGQEQFLCGDSLMT